MTRSGTTLLHPLPAENRDVQQRIDFCPAQLVLHPHADKGAYQLIEDEELLTLDFRNAYPSLLYKIPTLDVMVVLGEDGAGAIRFLPTRTAGPRRTPAHS